MKLRSILFLAAFFVIAVNAGAQTFSPKAKEYLISSGKLEGMSPDEINNLRLTREYTSRHNGVRHLYFLQTHSGIAVHNGVIGIHFDKSGEVAGFTSSAVKSLTRKINAVNPSIDAATALLRACEHLGLKMDGNAVLLEPLIGAEQSGVFEKGNVAIKDIPVKLVYQNISENEVRLAWQFEIYEISTLHWWQIRMDAQTGAYLDKSDYVVSCTFGGEDGCGHSHMQTPGGAGQLVEKPLLFPLNPPAPNSYNVFELPIEAPSFGSRSNATSPWLNNPSASPYGWHDTNGAAGNEYTYTRGNNVYASEDRNADNLPGFAPDGGANLDFDFALDLSQNPVNYQSAAITNLFYSNNMMHDILYNYGFTEEAGNFQENNYGNGGQGGDSVDADAQDGSGTNNANFATPPDGDNPRMQMYEWTYGQVPVLRYNGIYYNAQGAQFNPVVANVTAEVVLANDGSPSPTLACNALVNNVSGKIVLIDRGTCSFVTKVNNAIAAGAAGVIIIQNVVDPPFVMGGVGPLAVPSVMVSLADGNLFKSLLLNGAVTATIQIAPQVNTDSDLDNGIIAHEYGHGVSNRLTGGPDITTCLSNEEQMGEGWSDYFALITTIEPGDTGNDPRPIGTYVFGQSPAGNGIRAYPYSIDFNINPTTYNDIQTFAVPHGVGSIWCQMLWDMTWKLIDIYGFDPDLYNGMGGNTIALQLVMDGMALQACSPGFVDGRDAILLADELNYGGIHHCLIWETFAARGLGYSANQGSSFSRSDGDEAFDLPPSCLLDIEKSGSTIANAGSTITYTLTVTNNSAVSATNVVVTDQIPAEVTFVNGSSSCGGSLNGQTLSIPLGTISPGASLICTYQVEVPPSPFTTFIFQDNIEEGPGNFTVSNNAPGYNWSIASTQAYSGESSWYAPDPNDVTDMYLRIGPIGPLSANSELRFWHYYNVEEDWDGAVLEISTNGLTWTDLGPQIIQNGYNNTIIVNPANAISGRNAWSGNSGGFIQTVVNLANWNGQSPYIRWRAASDEFVGGAGWWVDDITITNGFVDMVNLACVASDQFPDDCDEVYSVIVESNCEILNWYQDSDGDGYGNAFVILSACEQPVGYVNSADDCDDANGQVYPGAPGTNEGVDNDCSGVLESDEVYICFGDFNNDGSRDVADLLNLLTEFSCLNNCTTDLNDDGVINSGDLLSFLGVYGTQCP
jgi:uncharacterized repeat protein (TIGR01451 family)